MLTAGARLMQPAPAPARLMLAAVAVSAVLHGLLAGAALLRRAPLVPESVPPIEVELVREDAERIGAPPPPSPSSVSAPKQPEGDGQAPAASARPPPPTPAVKPAPAEPAPEINLGNGLQNRDPLTVLGDNIRPPAPDARFRNRPPNYPPDAANIGAEGVVQLLVRVTAAGIPADVIVVRTSGNSSLDASAREAVQLWRFNPARAGGRAVPFDYALNIKFTLGDH